MTSGENVGDLSLRCQKVVDDANAGRISLVDAQEKLQAKGISGSVLQSYLVQLQKAPGEGGDGSSSNVDRGKTPEGLDDNQREEFRRRRTEILGREGTGVGGSGGAEEHEGNEGRREVQELQSNVLSHQLQAIERLLNPELGGISASTLDSLPHLREKATSTGDPHVDETLHTKRVYLREQGLDALVDLFQTRVLPEPLPRTIWKLIIKDEYVSFEKLLAGIDPGYDHQDEGKDFGTGYSLVKTDHLSARKPVISESDWNRAFDAWKNGVVQAYPHRAAELSNYGLGVSNLFRNFAHDPSIPIRTDHEVRERYHKSPFRLDDTNRTQAAVMALVHRTSAGSRSKRPLDSSSSGRPSKRSGGAICLNWNGARCDDPCVNGRRYGMCSICRGKHRAFDSPECKSEFLARRARNVADRESNTGGPSRT
ncbi:hypothetical protein F5880DRAFT_1494146 [Lentinula raphanica]|nr:hypothetical protein F5880DRAFT_1494146 [Lentinula raphanica]